MSWRFNPDEFAHVWRETDLDAYPYPIRLLESPTTQHEAQRLRQELEVRLPPGDDADLTLALTILARPHTRITVFGAAAEPGVEIRIIAAVVRRRAVLAVQEPGDSADFGGVVHISMGHAARVGCRIAATLPLCAHGREPGRVASTTVLRTSTPLTLAGELDTATVDGQIIALLHRPRAATGHIQIEPRLDREQPPLPTYFSWIDIADDGRYLIRPGEEFYIGPGPLDTIAEQIQRRVPVNW